MAVFLEEDVRFMNSLSGFHSDPYNNNPMGPHVIQNDAGMTLLGGGFAPNEHTVVCGRAKHFALAPGNQRLKKLVESYLKVYSQANTKSKKSAIVSRIVETVKSKSPLGGFVKFEEGSWWEVDAGFAREKVGCLLRDRLHYQYRSSSKAKMARRQKQKATTKANAKTENKSASDDGNADNVGTTTSQDAVANDSISSRNSNNGVSLPEKMQQGDKNFLEKDSSPLQSLYTTSSQRNRDDSNTLMMSSIPNSLALPKSFANNQEEGCDWGDWRSVMDTALFDIVGVPRRGSEMKCFDDSDNNNNNMMMFIPTLVDDIPIQPDDVPISVDDISNIFDDF